MDLERRRVFGDGRLDDTPRFAAQPRLEDRAVRASIRADAVDDQFVVERHDVRSTHPRHGRHDPHPVQSAAERDAATVPRPASRGDTPSDVRLVTQVPAQPRLALREKRARTALVIRTDRPGRNGDDDAPLGVDDDPQDAGAG